MKKIKLNAVHRQLLLEFAAQKILLSQAHMLEAKAKLARHVSILVRNDLSARFPPADMAVLRKYRQAESVTSVDNVMPCWRTTGFVTPQQEREHPRAVQDVVRFDCVEVPRYWRYDVNSVHYDQTRRPGVEIQDAIQTWWTQCHAVHDDKLSRMKNYSTLVRESRTFEDVVAVWPEAAELVDKICAPALQLPARVTPDLREAIQRDMADRGFPPNVATQ